MAIIQRAFRGFGRELFTDTGQYSISFNAPEEEGLSNHGELIRAPHRSHGRDLTLDERAVVLATAVDIDYDYFSRHSEGHHLGLPIGWGSGE